MAIQNRIKDTRTENLTQQEFLRKAAKSLSLSQTDLAKRMCAPWNTYKKWQLPSESENFREMPEIAWQLVREIIDHETLKSVKKHCIAHERSP